MTLPKVDLSVYIPQLSSFKQLVRSECGETNNFGMNIEAFNVEILHLSCVRQ